MEKEVIDIYNKIAGAYDKSRERKTFYNDYLEMPTTLSFLKNVREKRVLDLGCGTGLFSKMLKTRGAEVFGIDMSQKMIEIAKSNVKGVDFRVGTVYKLPYKSNYFDVIVSSLVFDYFNNLDRAFKEIRRVLKTNAMLIFSISNPVVNSTKRIKGKSRLYRQFGNYFNEGKTYEYWPTFKVKPPFIHRTYQTWIKTLIRNDFIIEDYVDAKPIKQGKIIDRTAYEFTSKVPYFCVFKIRKSDF